MNDVWDDGPHADDWWWPVDARIPADVPGLTPAAHPVVQGLPGNWLQVRKDGLAIGNANVAVLDIVGDPAQLHATRGVGVNAHVVTIRRIPPAGPPIGWLSAINDAGGVAAHANNGIGWLTFALSSPFVVVGRDLYAGIVGYTSGTIVWSLTWAPLASDPAPTITNPNVNPVQIHWPLKPPGSDTESGVEGQLTLTCTLNGIPVAVGQRLIMSGANLVAGSYAQVAWGPEP